MILIVVVIFVKVLTFFEVWRIEIDKGLLGKFRQNCFNKLHSIKVIEADAVCISTNALHSLHKVFLIKTCI